MTHTFNLGDEVRIPTMGNITGVVINTNFQRVGSQKLSVELDDGIVVTINSTECWKNN